MSPIQTAKQTRRIVHRNDTLKFNEAVTVKVGVIAKRLLWKVASSLLPLY